MDKDIWIMKHKGWSIAITLLIIFLVFIFFFLRNSEQTDLTGKVVGGSSQNASGQVESQEQNKCLDSDGGKDYYTKGYIDLETEKFDDECVGSNSNRLIEQTCEGVEFYECLYGCSDGKCNLKTEEQQNQETEKCDWGYSDEYKCDGKVIKRKWINSNCSFDWFYSESCDYSCENGGCKDKPVQESEGTETCEVGYLEDYKCNNNWRQRKWQSLFCSTEWKNFEYCSYGCSEDKCNSKPQEQSDYFTVTRVIDGDTIEINTGERIRLICIDTPETYEEGYQEAKNYLTKLILNKEVYLEKDVSETDRYGRLLRYIYTEYPTIDLDGHFINLMIVLNGYGKAYPYSPDTTLCPQIENAEEIARENHLGIWAEEEEETCEAGYLNEYKCNGKNIERKYQYSDCSFTWFYNDYCSYGCSNGKCNSKTCEVGYLNEYKCHDKYYLEQKYQYSDCTFTWLWYKDCDYRCSAGRCISEYEYYCSSNYFNCADFSSQAQAQAMFEFCGGIYHDVHYLDGDNDGLACETLP